MIDITKFDGHTAGPWQLTEFGRVMDPNQRVVADIGGWAWRERHSKTSAQDANARLIAAAPELLAEVIRLRAEVAALKGGAE